LSHQAIVERREIVDAFEAGMRGYTYFESWVRPTRRAKGKGRRDADRPPRAL